MIELWQWVSVNKGFDFMFREAKSTYLGLFSWECSEILDQRDSLDHALELCTCPRSHIFTKLFFVKIDYLKLMFREHCKIFEKH